MSHRLDFVTRLTAVNADVLSGSALDPMPGNGFLRVYACDINGLATIEVDPASHPSPTGTGGQFMTERATIPEIRAYDPHYETEVNAGEKVTLRIAGTVTEVMVWASFMSAR